MSAFVRKLGNIEKVSSLGIGNCQSFIMWWTTQLRELGAEFSFHYGSELTPLPGLWNENTVKAFAWVAVDARGQKHQHQRFRRDYRIARFKKPYFKSKTQLKRIQCTSLVRIKLFRQRWTIVGAGVSN